MTYKFNKQSKSCIDENFDDHLVHICDFFSQSLIRTWCNLAKVDHDDNNIIIPLQFFPCKEGYSSRDRVRMTKVQTHGALCAHK